MHGRRRRGWLRNRSACLGGSLSGSLYSRLRSVATRFGARQNGPRMADRAVIRACFNQYFLQHTLVEGFQLNNGLVSLDFGKYVSCRDLVTDALAPLQDFSLRYT